jgi:transposase-like protein
MTATKKPIDWERIELDYRAGILTLRELSEKHGVSHVTIHKRAKRDEWSRDLAAKIQAKVEELANRAEANRSDNKNAAVNEREVINSSAEAILAITTGHKGRARRHGELVDKLLVELEGSDENLAARVDISKKLGETLKTLIAIERDAFGIVTASKLDVTTTDATPRSGLDDFYATNP